MADDFVYRITYDTGEIKLGNRRMVGGACSEKLKPYWYKHPVKIERAPEVQWEDVTTEFLGD